jgi:hypothetical protein
MPTSPNPARRSLSVLVVATMVAVSSLHPVSALAAGTPAGLEFVVSPGGGPSNVPWARQPIVRIVDATGTTATDSHLAVALRRAQSAKGLLICNANPVTAVNGIATFDGCWLNEAQSGATLIATAFRLPSATSAPFDVGPPVEEPPARLVFDFAGQEPPFTATAEGPIWFDVRVRIVDAGFVTITSGPLSTIQVTFSVAPNPAGASVTCPGGNTVSALAGLATFQGCSFSRAAFGLSIVASAPGLGDGYFNGIDVWPAGSPRGPRLDLFTGNPAPTWGQPVDFDVTVDQLPASSSGANRRVHVQATDNPYDPDSWRTIDDVTTGTDGRAAWHGYTPRTNHWYRAYFEGAPDLGPAVSLLSRIVVRQKLVARPAFTGIRLVPRGTTVDFLTVVRPLLGDPPPGVIRVQIDAPLKSARRWPLMLTADATGRASLPIRFDAIGRWVIRFQVERTTSNANSYPVLAGRYDVR